MVPGVFLCALASAMVRREFVVRSFDPSTGTVRYLGGAVLMGFGGMLAGGCAVGAGVTGGSILSLTAWAALVSMWIGGAVAQVAETSLARAKFRAEPLTPGGTQSIDVQTQMGGLQPPPIPQ